MRTLFLVVPFIIVFLLKGEEKIVWQSNLQEAIQLAQDNDKNILIYFTGSDWCAPCIKLKEDLFDTTEFQEVSERFILLYIDIPRKNDVISREQKEHNQQVFKKYNKTGVFPLFLVVSPKEKVLDEYSGYSMNGEIGYHIEFLKRNQ
ncbi:thioredoxin family protein [Croceivirga thetidis]|uniref:Thioredoxin family protein n=1 Tax=Croceivirga thetidis TaxID=2721623 RepID=A0ABX1GR79_9FLAO|nr:thioredoxin family protein [Croceivirga thetidis]NKI32133.1 thioredoxin family protein [Croceivirga thetidis]